MTETVEPKSIANDTIARQFGPGDQPVLTGDGVAAFALYMAGTPFVDDSLWCINYYTADILRKLGYGGLSMREGAIKAVKDGKRGVVRFMLKRPSNEVNTAYLNQQKEIEDGEGTAKDVLCNILNDFKSGAVPLDQTIAKAVCLILKMRIRFMNGWKDTVPLLRIDDEREPRTTTGLDGARVVEMGGFKFISVNASKATKEKLGL